MKITLTQIKKIAAIHNNIEVEKKEQDTFIIEDKTSGAACVICLNGKKEIATLRLTRNTEFINEILNRALKLYNHSIDKDVRVILRDKGETMHDMETIDGKDNLKALSRLLNAIETLIDDEIFIEDYEEGFSDYEDININELKEKHIEDLKDIKELTEALNIKPMKEFEDYRTAEEKEEDKRREESRELVREGIKLNKRIKYLKEKREDDLKRMKRFEERGEAGDADMAVKLDVAAENKADKIKQSKERIEEIEAKLEELETKPHSPKLVEENNDDFIKEFEEYTESKKEMLKNIRELNLNMSNEGQEDLIKASQELKKLGIELFHIKKREVKGEELINKMKEVKEGYEILEKEYNEYINNNKEKKNMIIGKKVMHVFGMEEAPRSTEIVEEKKEIVEEVETVTNKEIEEVKEHIATIEKALDSYVGRDDANAQVTALNNARLEYFKELKELKNKIKLQEEVKEKFEEEANDAAYEIEYTVNEEYQAGVVEVAKELCSKEATEARVQKAVEEINLDEVIKEAFETEEQDFEEYTIESLELQIEEATEAAKGYDKNERASRVIKIVTGKDVDAEGMTFGDFLNMMEEEEEEIQEEETPHTLEAQLERIKIAFLREENKRTVEKLQAQAEDFEATSKWYDNQATIERRLKNNRAVQQSKMSSSRYKAEAKKKQKEIQEANDLLDYRMNNLVDTDEIPF